jgi:hypothetical protein
MFRRISNFYSPELMRQPADGVCWNAQAAMLLSSDIAEKQIQASRRDPGNALLLSPDLA